MAEPDIAARQAAQPRPGARLAVVGMSSTPICGVRDHARLLAGALAEEGWQCTTHWLDREPTGAIAERRMVGAFARRLRDELRRERPDAVLLHYSVFAFAHRGLPIHVRTVTSALRAVGVPVLVVIHEAAYPWTIGGLRGKLWALTQRVALIDVMRCSAGVLVTADFRAEWLRSRPWLKRRPVAMAPVFSNLPPPGPVERSANSGRRIGLFGYSYEGVSGALVLDALGLLRARGVPAELTLLGAPGGESSSARAWLQAARARGLEESLSFSGMLSGQQLSDELARCEVLLFVGAAGPSSRKGTLAASLASGRAVIALDGPRRWEELVDAGAIRLVAQTPAALAEGLAELLGDEQTREALGARGRVFAHERMGTARTARAVGELLREVGV